MKKVVTTLVLLFILVCSAITLIECTATKTGPEAEPPRPVYYEVKVPKKHYEYGEEITIELLFNPVDPSVFTKSGNTYCVKLNESPYYEIVGDNVVYTDGSENEESIKGRWGGQYWYRVTFTIKVNEEFEGLQHFVIYMKCLEDDWLDHVYYNNDYVSDDPQYQYKGNVYLQYETSSSGINFERKSSSNWHISKNYVITLKDLFNID